MEQNGRTTFNLSFELYFLGAPSMHSIPVASDKERLPAAVVRVEYDIFSLVLCDFSQDPILVWSFG